MRAGAAVAVWLTLVWRRATGLARLAASDARFWPTRLIPHWRALLARRSSPTSPMPSEAPGHDDHLQLSLPLWQFLRLVDVMSQRAAWSTDPVARRLCRRWQTLQDNLHARLVDRYRARSWRMADWLEDGRAPVALRSWEERRVVLYAVGALWRDCRARVLLLRDDAESCEEARVELCAWHDLWQSLGGRPLRASDRSQDPERLASDTLWRPPSGWTIHEKDQQRQDGAATMTR